jgi:hypothetical protein
MELKYKSMCRGYWTVGGLLRMVAGAQFRKDNDDNGKVNVGQSQNFLFRIFEFSNPPSFSGQNPALPLLRI